MRRHLLTYWPGYVAPAGFVLAALGGFGLVAWWVAVPAGVAGAIAFGFLAAP